MNSTLMSGKCWGIPREHCSSIMTVIYHNRALCLFTLGNEWPFCFRGQSQTGPCRHWCRLGAIHHASLSPSLPSTTPPGKYSGLKDHSRGKPSWVNYFKSKYCLTLPAASLFFFLPFSLHLALRCDSLGLESDHLTVVSGREGSNPQEESIPTVDDSCRVLVLLCFCVAGLPFIPTGNFYHPSSERPAAQKIT